MLCGERALDRRTPNAIWEHGRGGDMVEKRDSKNRTAMRDDIWGAADRNRAVRVHMARARASAALARPTPPPIAVRRRGLRGCVRETGRVEGRTWVGKGRATNGSAGAQNLKPQRPKLDATVAVFSRARVPISGPILRTRFWS